MTGHTLAAYHALLWDAWCGRRRAILDLLSMVPMYPDAYETIRSRVYDLEDAMERHDANTLEVIAADIAHAFAEELGLGTYTRLRALADEMQRACFAGDMPKAHRLRRAFDRRQRRRHG